MKNTAFLLITILSLMSLLNACSKTINNVKENHDYFTSKEEFINTEDYTNLGRDIILNNYDYEYEQIPIENDTSKEHNTMLNNTDEYSEFTESNFKLVSTSPLSTFSIDVDTASYTHLRSKINSGIFPTYEAIRIEEMINYFSYNYENPSGDVPFTINTEIGVCPWKQENYLLTIGLQGKKIDKDNLPNSNLVFLIDVSGSMDYPNRLPLLKNAFSQLVNALDKNDLISIVVYAGASGVVLDSVPGNEKLVILSALESLTSGGSTAGSEGIDLAYEIATKNYIPDGNNRIILATDGDFNVGPSSLKELEEIIVEKRKSGIYLSVLGFGMGNLKDNTMELVANKGNGNYYYIDSTREAKKVLVDEMAGTLFTIAKDVKIQLEFNPETVESYRLIGYDNRTLRDEDFQNDSVDAGELGIGHNVTAIYEIIPKQGYNVAEVSSSFTTTDELATIKLRYKEPEHSQSKEIKHKVYFTPIENTNSSVDFHFVTSVTEFGLILRNSPYKGNATIESVLTRSELGLGVDPEGYRAEFLELVKKYASMIRPH